MTFFGGTIRGKADSDGAGIGGGDENSNEHRGRVAMYGCEVTAIGGAYAAGIGGGDEENGFGVIISGGKVTATGGEEGAGIGGGENSDGGSVTISKDALKAVATAGKGDGDGAQAIGHAG